MYYLYWWIKKVHFNFCAVHIIEPILSNRRSDLTTQSTIFRPKLMRNGPVDQLLAIKNQAPKSDQLAQATIHLLKKPQFLRKKLLQKRLMPRSLQRKKEVRRALDRRNLFKVGWVSSNKRLTQCSSEYLSILMSWSLPIFMSSFTKN